MDDLRPFQEQAVCHDGELTSSQETALCHLEMLAQMVTGEFVNYGGRHCRATDPCQARKGPPLK